jgi:hypothetical protein
MPLRVLWPDNVIEYKVVLKICNAFFTEFFKMKFTYVSGSLLGSILLLQCCPVSGKPRMAQRFFQRTNTRQNDHPTMAT